MNEITWDQIRQNVRSHYKEARNGGFASTEFRLGEIEHLPVEDRNWVPNGNLEHYIVSAAIKAVKPQERRG